LPLSAVGQIPDAEAIHVNAIIGDRALREMNTEKDVSGRAYLFGACYCLCGW